MTEPACGQGLKRNSIEGMVAANDSAHSICSCVYMAKTFAVTMPTIPFPFSSKGLRAEC